MPDKILGLDISPDSVKALLLERRGLGGGRILDFAVADIRSCGSLEQALQAIAANENFHGIPCCAHLPLAEIMFRQVTLPFRDENKIKKTLVFELEGLLPLPVEEIAASHLIAAGGGILAAVAGKERLREFIAAVENNFGEVPIIDVASIPLSLLLLEQRSAGCGFVLDINFDSTAIIFYENGAIAQIRSLSFSGNQMTRAYAADMEIEQEETTIRKRANDCDRAGARVTDLLNTLCREIKNTAEFLKLSGILKSDPTFIYLTGDSAPALLPKELTDCLAIPVELVDLAGLRQIDIAAQRQAQYEPQLMNAALALALRGLAGLKSFNFRQGEFAAATTYTKMKGQLQWAAIAASVILVLFLINQFLDYNLQEQRLGNIKKQISYIFQKNIPGAAMVDPVQQLKNKLNENKKTYNIYSGSQEKTALEVLKEISAFITPAQDVLLTNYSQENDILLIKGEAANSDIVAAVRSELLKSRYFREVVIGATSSARQGAKIEFDLRITLK